MDRAMGQVFQNVYVKFMTLARALHHPPAFGDLNLHLFHVKQDVADCLSVVPRSKPLGDGLASENWLVNSPTLRNHLGMRIVIVTRQKDFDIATYSLGI